MEFFVQESSIVRKIWGKSDTILFIFAGAAAEFALNKAVDWLYFTGRLPADPIGRLFSTVSYARKIVFSEKQQALKAIDQISSIHKQVETERGGAIPDWAYRDVLFMLIYYSIASFELLERKLTAREKEEVFEVFYRVGQRMNLSGLPVNYADWLIHRKKHMELDLSHSFYTDHLFLQYKKHLGGARFKILKEAQKLVLPAIIKPLLHFKTYSLLTPCVPIYRWLRRVNLDGLVRALLLPKQYKKQIRALDVTH